MAEKITSTNNAISGAYVPQANLANLLKGLCGGGVIIFVCIDMLLPVIHQKMQLSSRE